MTHRNMPTLTPTLTLTLILFLGLCLLSLGWFGWTWIRREYMKTGPTTANKPSDQTEHTEPAGKADLEGEGSAANRPLPSRKHLPSRQQAPWRKELTPRKAPRRPSPQIPPDQAAEVQVVRRDTGQPIAGATVLYLTFDFRDRYSKEDLEELRSQAPDIEALLRRFGEEVTCDGQGIAVVRNHPRGTMICASKNGLFGQLLMERRQEPPAGGWQLELSPDRTLELQVVDLDGQPLAGVPLVMTCTPQERRSDRVRTIHRRIGESKDADGRLVLPHVQIILHDWLRTRGTIRDLSCVIDLPGLQQTAKRLDLNHPLPRPLQLVLPETGRIKVEVLDAGGEPATISPSVGLKVEGKDRRWSGRRGKESAILFERVGLGKRYELSARVGRLVEKQIVTGPRIAGEEVLVRFKMPATGSIVVRVTNAEELPLSASSGYVNLEDQSGPFRSQERFDEEGKAVFKLVPLGRHFVVSAFLLGPPIKRSVVGPGRLGEEILVELTPPANAPVLVGRVLDSSGKPLAERTLYLRIKSRRGNYGGRVTTNSKGRFQMVLQVSRMGQQIEFLELRLHDKTGFTGDVAALPHSGSLAAGVTDFGDVVLTKPALVLSGRLVGVSDSRDGRDQPHLSIEWLRIYNRRGVRREFWRREESLQPVYLEGGRFEFRGSPQPARLRLRISARAFLPVVPTEFAVGTQNLEIRMTRGGSLRAMVRLDEKIPGNTIRAELDPDDSELPEVDLRGSRIGRIESGWRQHGGKLQFRWIGLRPGTYRLVLRPFGAGQPLFTLGGIRIVGGEETKDRRLQSVDLRGRVQAITLTVTGPDGRYQPLNRSNGIVLIGRLTDKTDMEGYRLDGEGRVTLAAAELPLRAVVSVGGYRIKEVEGISQDTTIRLEAPLRVRVKLSGGGPEMPQGKTLSLSLRLQGSQDPASKARRYRAPGIMSGGLSSVLSSSAHRVSAKKGEALFDVPRPGVYEVLIALRDSSSRSWWRRIELSKPASFLIQSSEAEQLFELTIPQQAIDLALK